MTSTSWNVRDRILETISRIKSDHQKKNAILAMARTWQRYPLPKPPASYRPGKLVQAAHHAYEEHEAAQKAETISRIVYSPLATLPVNPNFVTQPYPKDNTDDTEHVPAFRAERLLRKMARN